MFQITLLQAAIAIGFYMFRVLGIVFLVGMLVCVPIVMKRLRKETGKEGSTPDKLPYYRQIGYFIYSIFISACIMVVVCLVVMVGLVLMIGPIM